MTAQEIYNMEFDYMMSIVDSGKEKEIARCNRVLKEMDTIMMTYGVDQYQSKCEIERKFPINMLPHTHPRRYANL